MMKSLFARVQSKKHNCHQALLCMFVMFFNDGVNCGTSVVDDGRRWFFVQSSCAVIVKVSQGNVNLSHDK